MQRGEMLLWFWQHMCHLNRFPNMVLHSAIARTYCQRSFVFVERFAEIAGSVSPVSLRSPTSI